MLEFLVVADDRTGALEVAGLAADAGVGSVLVLTDVSARPATSAGVTVVDLESRHLDASDAAGRASQIDVNCPAAALGHKIDSTLRGNWHHEVLARSASTGRRVLVVPAFPALGRTCADGVVRADGVPVADGPAGRDPVTPVGSSRPADLLAAGGSAAVAELHDADDVARWAAGEGRVAVCDAQTDDDLRSIAERWKSSSREVLFAGTGAAVAAAVATMVRRGSAGAAPRLAAPVLVVCGSLHTAARRQLDVLRAERPSVEILTTPMSPTSLDPNGIEVSEARRIVEALAVQAHDRLRQGRHRTLVVLGGDTAAAVLGPAPVLVGGTLAPGLPWLRRLDGSGPLILTRSGGFGDERALVELLDALPEEEGPR